MTNIVSANASRPENPTHRRELKFSDSAMFDRVMLDEEVCKGILEVILGKRIKEVEFHDVEHVLKPRIDSRGVRVDVYLEGDGNVYDIEMQSYRERNLPKRFRYYQSCIDARQMDPGVAYRSLPLSYIIFICTSDPFGRGLARYDIERVCVNDPETPFDCRAHWIALNASAYENAGSLKLKSLLQYICDDTAGLGDELVGKIREQVDIANADRKWVAEVWSVMTVEENLRQNAIMALEDGREEGREIGLKEGREEGLAEGRAEGREKGLAEGRAEGLAEGRTEGREASRKLIASLVKDGRTDELTAMADDPVLMGKLLEEYGLV